ncbi:RelA/SpoT family protein [Idiomarina sp. 29L]|uniref:RelA/SpoT family protein n=1 Tax=Idiomarina sp. 29L TaxID=2508877 RepID=UPI0010126AC9|nr:RelA/SpoT family protein [Idiomarina sp. 29L]RXS42919.1 RelA/SpoT family protein [Idiomarina sp. 29L]
MQVDYSDRVIRELNKEIEYVLNPAGLLYRVFGRAKSEYSLDKKVKKEPGKYTPDGKNIQDFLGVRITLYFADDIDVAVELLKENFVFLSEDSVIDKPEGDVFSARRCNLIFELPDSFDVVYPRKFESIIDKTFEVQFRTVLSEGWHEVEHDLRYKAKEDWQGHDDLSRALNGIYATLETSDWGMIKLFEELSYRHYKSGNLDEMLKTKFRLRLTSGLSDPVREIVQADNSILKKVFRAPRTTIVKDLSFVCKFVPLTPDVLIQVINRKIIKDDKIKETEVDVLKVQLDSYESSQS